MHNDTNPLINFDKILLTMILFKLIFTMIVMEKEYLNPYRL